MPAHRARLRQSLVPILMAGVVACGGDPSTAPGAGQEPSLAAATGPLAFVQVTQGITHSCGVTADNRAYCWGDNFFGELGDGTTTQRLVPRAVAGGLRFRLVSAGNHFTCGLTTEDRAYCWGDNLYYALGDGTAQQKRLAPVAVAGNRRYRQLRAGTQHACAVTLGDVTFCWGNNGSGQLGAVTPGFLQSNVPLKVVTGGPVFRRVVPGGSFTCALTRDGVAYCWGDNSLGQLGNGSHTPTMTPARVSGTRTFSQLSAGLVHACGVAGGKAFCWGSGGVGDGTGLERAVPTAVAGGLTFKGVSASFNFTCGITGADRAYCWGSNAYGQLGDGTFGPRKYSLVPAKVLGGHAFTAIGGMASTGHTCAVTPDNRAYCWGDNSRGQLGIGTLVRSARPAPVS